MEKLITWIKQGLILAFLLYVVVLIYALAFNEPLFDKMTLALTHKTTKAVEQTKDTRENLKKLKKDAEELKK